MNPLGRYNSHELGMELQRRGHIAIIWSFEDVMVVRPDWTSGEAIAWLAKNHRAFHEMQVGNGNEMLDDMTSNENA